MSKEKKILIDINIEKLKQSILNEKSAVQIAQDVGCSTPTIYKAIRLFLPDYKLKLTQNGRRNQSKSMAGKQNKLWRANRGKTYDQIYGTEHAIKMRECRSNWLKQNNIRRFTTKISKPQRALYNIVKLDYPTALLEYEIKILSTRSIWLDIAIPEYKICIEYDGIYWHELNDSTISIKDKYRDEYLRSIGWRVYRIRSIQNLNEAELKTEYNKFKLNEYNK